MIAVTEDTAAPTAAELRRVMDELAAPFDPREVRFKPTVVKGNRALAMAYIDARLVMDRLDAVVGVGRWKDDYQVLDGGSVVCRLSVRVGGEWVTKCDVGSPSEQPDEGDRAKAAFSDALKRAAVKWGTGRYLYRLPAQWVDFDRAKKQIVAPPQLPAWAVPAGAAPAQQQPAGQPPKPPTQAEINAEVERLRKAFAGCQTRQQWKGLCDEVTVSHRRGLLPAVVQPAVKGAVNAADARLPRDPAAK